MSRLTKYTNVRKPEDEEPVFYCRSCHSLHIVVNDMLANDDWDGSYCKDCMSTDIGQCDIEEWLDVERDRQKVEEEIEWNR